MQLLQRAVFRIALGLALLGGCIWPPRIAHAEELKFPQMIHIRYEAVDPKAGGQFLIWVEREKIWYGLDPKLYPPTIVEVTTVTPPGSTSLTMIAVTHLNSPIPDYFHLSGIVRFKVSGMTIKSSNMP